MSQKYDCTAKIIESVEPYINDCEFVLEKKTANFITEASFVDSKTKIILGVGPVTAHEVNENITSESYDKLVEQYIKIIENYSLKNKSCF